MKVSVLIANYNGADYISDCINSLKNQSYKDVEIIFFDDKSTDLSLEIIKKFSGVVILSNNKEKQKYSSFNR